MRTTTVSTYICDHCGWDVQPNKGSYGVSTDRVLAMRKAHPEMSCTAIGRQVGITRERVRQILHRARLPTDIRKKRYCICGTYRPRPLARYCSEACKERAKAERHARTVVTITCIVCGKQKDWNRRQLEWKRQRGIAIGMYCRTCSYLVTGSRLGKLPRTRKGNASPPLTPA